MQGFPVEQRLGGKIEPVTTLLARSRAEEGRDHLADRRLVLVPLVDPGLRRGMAECRQATWAEVVDGNRAVSLDTVPPRRKRPRAGVLSANSSKKHQPKASMNRTTTVSGRSARAPKVSGGRVREFGSPVSAASSVHGMREKQYES